MNPVSRLRAKMSQVKITSAPHRNPRNKTEQRRRVVGEVGARAKVRTPPDNFHPFIPALFLFVSGAAALAYQLLWIKQLSLVVGIEVYAITTAVSAFFGGLALGGAVFGRLADRAVRPLRFYARLEFGVAVSAVFVTLALAHAASPFATLESKLGIFAWLPLFLLVAAPAVLMGGTLPVLARALAPRPDRVARVGGVLYSANTAGAVVGALLTPFALLPQFGVRGSAYVAAVVNLAVAISAVLLDRRAAPAVVESDVHPPRSVSSEARLALALYSIAGGIALGYEIVWSQAIIQFMSTRSFAFAIVLATYLTGLVVGSALYSRFADQVRNPWRMFGTLIASAALLALIGTAGIGKWFVFLQYYAGQSVYGVTSSVMAEMCTRFFVASAVVIFPAALVLGAAFPAALRLVVNAGYVGRDVGSVLALNTAGGILGTLGTGFVLIPWLGVIRSLAALAVAAALVGVIAALRGRQGIVADGSPQNTPWNFAVWPVTAIAFVTICVALFTPPQKLVDFIPHIHGSAGTVVFYEDDPGGTVAVVQEPSGPTSFRRLFIQGVSNSGDSLPSLRYMRLQTFIPLLVHTAEPRSALVIGLGTGITAGAMLRYPGLDVRVCDELLPGVIHSTKLFLGNFGAGSSPEIEIRHRDGRRDLLQSRQQYDVITLEPPPPSAEGVVNLYSSDFYALAAKRLNPGGIFAQWLPIATQNDEDSRSLVRSFLDVFPYASLWSTELHEMLLVGSLRPMDLDVNRMSARFNQPQVAQALSEVGIASPAALMGTWVTDRDGLERYAANAEPVTDDRPRIEYAVWVRPQEITKALPELLALRTPPPLRNADEQLWDEVIQKRDQMLLLYAAGLAAYKGDREGWASIMAKSGGPDMNNPYYRWLLGVEAPHADSSKALP
jgi:spermidine synthase